jgi:hypothetical protein
MREDDPKERIVKIIDEARRKGRLPAHYYADEILSVMGRLDVTIVSSPISRWLKNILLMLCLLGLLILLTTVLGIRFR